MNILLAIDQNGCAGQFNHCSFQLHDDVGDHGSIFHHCTPNLDVEILIGRFAVGCKDVIADPREIKDVPVEVLEVEVTPCAAHTAIVRGVASCGFKMTHKNFLQFAIDTLLLGCLDKVSHQYFEHIIISLSLLQIVCMIYPSITCVLFFFSLIILTIYKLSIKPHIDYHYLMN